MPAELIQRPDITFRVQQFLGLREARPLRHLAEQVQPCIIIGDVREVADEKVITRPCGGALLGQSSFAGSHFTIGLANPAGSGVVIRLEAIEFNGANPLSVVLEVPTVTGLGAVADVSFRDLAVSGAKPRAQLGGTEGLGFPAPIHGFIQPAPQGRAGFTWTIFPGCQLRLDSFDVSGSGQQQFYGLLWTESTMRSS
jgi:hypothetical protein